MLRFENYPIPKSLNGKVRDFRKCTTDLLCISHDLSPIYDPSKCALFVFPFMSGQASKPRMGAVRALVRGCCKTQCQL